MDKTTQEINEMIAGIGDPYSYGFIPEKEGKTTAPPFVVFFYPEGRDFYADGENYSYIDELRIRRYTAEPDLHGDRRILRRLNENGLSCRWERWYDDGEHLWVTEFIAEVSISEPEEGEDI